MARFWEVFEIQDGSKDAQEASKRLLRGSQDAARGSQGLPRGEKYGEIRATESKMALGGDLEVHFGAQERPKRGLRPPKRLPKGPPKVPRRLKIR